MGIRNAVVVAITTFICLYSAPSYAAVQGHVIDSDQTPIEGALVTFTDESNTANSFSCYTDADGWYEIDLMPLAVSEDQPQQFSLGQNYPNPFNPTTTIPYSLDTPSHVSLTIYNIMGQKVADLADQHMSAGQHIAVWDGMDNEGNHVSAGIYLYRLRAGRNVETRKMLLLDGGGVSGSSIAKPFYGTAKIADGITYTVNITHHSIIPYEETGVIIDDGQMRDFIVTLGGVASDITFVSIPGGTFQMGDAIGDLDRRCRPVHNVTVSDFEMSVYEITNAQYAEYLTDALASGDITEYDFIGGYWVRLGFMIHLNDSTCEISYRDGVFSVDKGKEHRPVVEVTWYGAKSFAAYYGFDLPTEAEWEYACRGGQQYMYGTDDGTIDSSKANYDENIGHTIDVGSYPENPFGLHDMSGNVWEWCHDRYEDYTSESENNPTGAQTGSYRVIRGSSCINNAFGCRSASRGPVIHNYGSELLGFRVVRRPGGVIY